PPDAEYGGSEDQAAVEILPRRQVETRLEERRRTMRDPSREHRVNADGANHDKREARVPCAKDVEKPHDLRRLGHARNPEPDREHDARRKSRCKSLHDAPNT